MSVTSLSKSQLIELYRTLVIYKAFPIIEVRVYENVLEFDDKHHVIDLQFVSKNGNQYNFSVITKTEPRCFVIKEQLEKYFIG